MIKDGENQKWGIQYTLLKDADGNDELGFRNSKIS